MFSLQGKGSAKLWKRSVGEESAGYEKRANHIAIKRGKAHPCD